MTPITILLIVVALIVVYAIFTFNSLVSFKNRAEEAWADIDVQLKRRFELIPNLINTVKGAANFETTTLEKVVAARNSALAGGAQQSVKEAAESENQITGALKSIFALSENYPDLKANASFLELQRELSDTEDKIQSARRFYNSNVMSLNTAIESFPGNIFANMFGFKKREFFELNEEDKTKMEKPVEVNF